MGQLFFRTLIGLAAGLLAWGLCEPFKPADLLDPGWAMWSLIYIFSLGLFIGLAVGGASGYSKGSRGHLLREAGLGALFSVIGCGIAISVASFVERSFGLHSSMNPSIIERLVLMIPLGLFMGAGVGAATLSVTGLAQGAIGGMIAGIVAGLLFNPISQALGYMILIAQHATTGEVGAPGRALLGALLGSLIALFVGLAQRVMRSAWLRLNLGRNEGKEWIIDRPQFLIGRSELANVPLFGDASIAPQHAYIIKHGNDYLIADPGGSPAGVLLNGQRVNQQALLFNGAAIQVGQTVLQFLLKSGQGHAPVGQVYNPYAAQQGAPQMPGMAAAQPYQPQPMQHPGMPTQGMPTQGMPTQGMQPTQAYGGYPQQPTAMQPTQNLQPTMLPGQGMQPTMMSMPAAAAGPSLVAIDGPLAGNRFPIGPGVELGRASQAVPMGYDTEASRRHASVAPSATGIMVQDLGSTNGTFVNNQRVQAVEARPGDLIKIGKTTFRIE